MSLLEIQRSGPLFSLSLICNKKNDENERDGTEAKNVVAAELTRTYVGAWVRKC